MTQQSPSSSTDELSETDCILCPVCKDLLKFPIMLVENIGNVCSTCYNEQQKLRNRKVLHNSVLEMIVKKLHLPCKFRIKGCEERLLYDDLLAHQKNCKYRTNLCLLLKFSGCKWEGQTTEFMSHFKESHTDHVINFENNFFFLKTLLTEMDLVKLLVTKNQTYILRMQTDSSKNKLFYFICNIKDDDILYEYSVKHKGTSDNYIKTKSRILSAYNIHNEFDENIAVQVDLEALRLISPISNTITSVFKIKVKDTQSDGVNQQMLLFFECPVCKNFMKPPIYQCQSGHSVCNLCRSRLDRCPTCRSLFGTTRNYSLEGLTSEVQYPCMYHDLGCKETSTVDQITKHENECPFKPYNCPFPRCTSNGNYNVIIAHLKALHPDDVICGVPSYTESFPLDPRTFYKMYDRKCVIAYDHIFHLVCKRLSERCLWVAEVFGINNHLKTFVYEVVVVDMHKPKRTLIQTDYCLSETSEDELFKNCIKFPNSLLSLYTNRGIVTYHFTIREK